MTFEKFYIEYVNVNLLTFIGLIFIPLEYIIPHDKNRKFFRGEFLQDLGWMYLNETPLLYLSDFLRKILLLSLIPKIFSLKIVIQSEIVIGIVLFLSKDFLSWVAHFTLHRFKRLWKAHILHHSSPTLDWLAGFRGHWLENLYFDAIPMIPFLFLKVSPVWYYLSSFQEAFFTFFLHSNIKVPNWKIFKFFTSPQYHRWHHSQEVYHKYGQNFGFYTTIWDRLFGTYYMPANPPEKYGVGMTYPKGFIDRFIYPFKD